ncbi:hypothetical protein HS7_18230 [Sulfolobales archaeon HS-7]|nr:hypothetical protein HS7_18230 [Sulfolobales archaeon HS-7]
MLMKVIYGVSVTETPKLGLVWYAMLQSTVPYIIPWALS